ncbi:MAG: hypothetical protein RLZZ252_173 [Bacteroidota bacterium]|jgi:alanine racemase
MGFRISAIDLVALLQAKSVEIPSGTGEHEVFIANANGVNEVGEGFITKNLIHRNISKILFDTRQASDAITSYSETLFLALIDKRNGHDFVEAAYQLGVRQFLVSEMRLGWSTLSEAIFYQVPNVLQSLQVLAGWYRKTLTMPIVGITGSNGKTIVKEWLCELLHQDFQDVYRSPRSFNSQLGVAISLLEIPRTCGLAIIEAGISARGEMRALQSMIKPNLVVFTHLGDAHDVGFANVEEKVAEKLILAEDADVLVYPFDKLVVREQVSLLKQRFPMMKTISWGQENGASFRLLPYREGDSGLQFIHRSVTHNIPLSQSDSASRDNSMSVLLTLVAFERWDQGHLDKFKFLPKLKNRLALVQGKRGNVVLNDTYSADIESLAVALEFLKQQSPHNQKVAILADFEQISRDQKAWILSVQNLLNRYSVDRLLLIGDIFGEYAHVFSGASVVSVYPTTQSLLNSGDLNLISHAGILVKGAHRFGLNSVVDALQERHHGTYLEIDLSALAYNFQVYKSKLTNGSRIMCMVKAFGYGSGTYEAAKRLDSLGVDYLGVAYLDEGIALRKAGVNAPIMVMNVDSSQWKLLKDNLLEPVIYSKELYDELVTFAFGSNESEPMCSASTPFKIHLELDTGMHRLGFELGQVAGLMSRLRDHRIRVASVFSHLSASEDQNNDNFTRFQIRQFSQEVFQIESVLGYSVLKHIDNSAGIVRFPEAQLSMVRLGIGLYGVDPSGLLSSELRPVNRLVTEISQVRTVKAGEGIGYGMHDVAAVDRKIAVIKMGYADGLLRMDGKGIGAVWILGQRAPLVGNICMDMAMVDVTHIPDCVPGVEVEIFGKYISVEEVAARRNTIAYEVLTSISQRVNRVFIEG